MNRKFWAFLAVSAWSFTSAAWASDERNVQVRFDAGASSTKIEDQIKGYQYVNYQLGAATGQKMWVELKSQNNATYFNVFEPGKGPGDQALYIGSINGNSFETVLPESGNYTVQVYMMRNAARRKETANYTLGIGIDAAASNAAESQSEGDAGSMRSDCSDRAAHIFHVRKSILETKYQGQRTDGSHAVNGSAQLRSGMETFQCSFSADGTTITQFIVN